MQHLESLNDVVEAITGVRQRETVPDWVVRDADQVELVDMTPEALRRRMAHGNIYAADKVDAALANYFRAGNLTALRELALLWVADKVDEALQRYMDEHGIDGAWETRERVVVAVTGAPSGDQLIRRAARMAQRTHGELIGVHVRSGDGLATGGHRDCCGDHQRLVARPGGRVPRGRRRRRGRGTGGVRPLGRRRPSSCWAPRSAAGGAELLHGSVINRVIRLSGAHRRPRHLLRPGDRPAPPAAAAASTRAHLCPAVARSPGG